MKILIDGDGCPLCLAGGDDQIARLDRAADLHRYLADESTDFVSVAVRRVLPR